MARPYDLPSLRALGSFEAAARHLSFKDAARELNVTPTAVSHQVRALEQDLNQPLFIRQHRGVELTPAGALLQSAVRRGLEAMSDAVIELRGSGAQTGIVIMATTAMSALWLTPKLTAFWRLHPDIVVSQIVSDAKMTDAAADMSLEYGALNPDARDCTLLFRDRISAVGAPDFGQRHGIGRAMDLSRAPLIHVTGGRHGWTEWSDWLAALGAPPSAGQRIEVNNYMIALQMAKDGIGAVLGWNGLVAPLIDAGELATLTAQSITTPDCFFVRMHRRASPQAVRFRDWLVDTYAGGPGSP